MKKFIIFFVLLIVSIGCSLFDAEEWREYKEDREERGINCYRRYNGDFYCKDKYGNEVY